MSDFARGRRDEDWVRTEERPETAEPAGRRPRPGEEDGAGAPCPDGLHAGRAQARGPDPSGGPRGPRAHDALARGVLSALARGGAGGPDPRRLPPLLAALTAAEADGVEAAVTDLLAAGIAPEEIVDRYVPAAARALGEGWVADELSFTVVTVASARLQTLVRDLGGDPGGSSPGGDGRGRTALMILPEGEAHSLGALVAADQLRRAGISTRLSLGRSARDVAAILRAGRYDLALLSYGCGTPLGAVAEAVAAVRRAAGRPILVAVGGSIATAPPEAAGSPDDARSGDAARDAARIRDRVGADFVGGDVLAAARCCGLVGAPRGTAP